MRLELFFSFAYAILRTYLCRVTMDLFCDSFAKVDPSEGVKEKEKHLFALEQYKKKNDQIFSALRI